MERAMNEDERKAVEWLNNWGRSTVLSQVDAINRHLPTLKSMLGEPRLPTELSPELIEAIWQAGVVSGSHRAFAHGVMRAIRDYVTKPKKLKPVFRLEGSQGKRHDFSLPITADWHDINQAITALCNDGYQVVTVRREMVPE